MKTPVYLRLNKGNPKVTRTVSQNPKTYTSKRRLKARSKLCMTWLSDYLGKAIASSNHKIVIVDEIPQPIEMTMNLSTGGWNEKHI